MKEITEIVRAFDQAKDQGQPCALLTLVHVEGSSYRRPGARMLVTDDGRMTGAISGGCLEGDALTKALFVLHRSQSMIVTYDTLDDDDAQMGVGLGCNGVIQVLIEPIDAADPINPIELLRQAATCRQETVLVTLFSLADRQGVQPGTCLLQMEDNTVTRLSPARQPALYARLFMDAEQALANGTSAFKNYVGEDLDMTAFIECLKPPLSLVILGAGNDVIPLVRMADILGWKTTVIDGRPRLAKQYRFLPSCHVFVADQQHALRHIPEDSRTAVLLMTHNYHYDQVVLRELLERERDATADFVRRLRQRPGITSHPWPGGSRYRCGDARRNRPIHPGGDKGIHGCETRTTFEDPRIGDSFGNRYPHRTNCPPGHPDAKPCT